MEKIKLAYIRCSWELSNGEYWKAQDIKGDLLTDLNLSFAHIDSKGLVQLSNKEYNKKQIEALHKTFPNLRINLSIGGWGAEGFSDAASCEKNRELFVQSTLALVKELELNGVDIDWEFPVGPDWGQKIKSRAQDKENYILLLKDLRQAFDKEEIICKKHFCVTTAVPSWVWFVQKNDVRAAAQICDYLNLMCYDYYGEWSETTGFNASLFINANDPRQWSSDSCIKLYSGAGVPAEKMVLGLPTYGFAWKGVPDNGTHGLFQKPEAFLGNFDVTQLEELYGPGYEDFFDQSAKQSYRYNKEKKIFVTYPSSDFIKAAMTYTKEQGLAGIMYWEYGHDMDGRILQMINDGMQGV